MSPSAHSSLDGSNAHRVTLITPTDQELETVVGEIRAHGVEGLGQHHNARSNESCDALHQAALAAFGHIDILCNVAGVCVEQTDLWSC